MVLLKRLRWLCFGLLLLASTHTASAEIYGGIDFPEGPSSFADFVLTYDPLYSGGPGPSAPQSLDPLDSLGIPDYENSADENYVTLGRGGLLELRFGDNLLTNSGSDLKDLHIFEIGPDVEDTFVAIRPLPETLALLDPSGDANGDGYFEIGKVFGATSSIDIDLLFPGFLPGELAFDAVQLIDDPNEGQTSGSTVGADIDAVGAISSVFVPEPSAGILAGLGLGVLAPLARRRQ
jgi:hypothetical protein